MTLASGSKAHQKRSLYIKQSQAFDILKQKSIISSESSSTPDFALSVSVDRTALSPCIIASPTAEFDSFQTQRFSFSYAQKNLDESPLVSEVASHVGLPASAQGRLAGLVQALWEIFQEKEAFVLETQIGITNDGNLEVHDARFGFDDAAFRSSGRQEDVHRLRNTAEEVPEEVEAEKDGIVYVKYDSTLLGRQLRLIILGCKVKVALARSVGLRFLTILHGLVSNLWDSKWGRFGYEHG